MKHRQEIIQLEAFLDDELTSEERLAFEKRLAESSELRLELAAAAKLKELMLELPLPAPHAGYWDESERLILARTIEGPPEVTPIRQATGEGRMVPSWVGTALSVAASLMIFFTALAVGSAQQGRSVVIMPRADYTAISAHSEKTNSAGWVMSEEERSLLASGIISVGSVGRSADLNITQDLLAMR